MLNKEDFTLKKALKQGLAIFLAVVSMLTCMSISFMTVFAENVSVEEVKCVTIQNVKTGQYLNYDYGTLKNGTPLRVWEWDGSKEQLFDIDNVKGDIYRILTHSSSKYCVDVYRGNAKLKAGLLCDIWKTGDDTTAQNVKFYKCDDGSFVIRMAANGNLALSGGKADSQVKLATFDATDKSQKWIFKDENGAKIDICPLVTDTAEETSAESTAPADTAEETTAESTATADTVEETTTESTTSADIIEEEEPEPEPLKFVKPLSSKYTTNKVTQEWADSPRCTHLGVDYGTYGNKSTNVISITDGEIYRIVKSEKSGGWGNFVIIKHKLANGTVFYSGYGHLSSFANIKVGDSVKAGTKIGVMGNTGFSTGPHLHLLVFTGSLGKSRVPAGYANKKISGNSFTYGSLTYYNPEKVISTSGSIIK